MAERNIIAEYAKYLQQMHLLSHTGQVLNEAQRQESLLLSYEQFKDFLILKLVGKDSFLDSLVRDYQKDSLVSL